MTPRSATSSCPRLSGAASSWWRSRRGARARRSPGRSGRSSKPTSPTTARCLPRSWRRSGASCASARASPTGRRGAGPWTRTSAGSLPGESGRRQRPPFWTGSRRSSERRAPVSGHPRSTPASRTPLQMSAGAVYLIGAGPGDPGLITVRGLELLRKADVVVYDRLVNPRLLDEAPPQALRIFAGKLAGIHSLPQGQINTLLIAHARAGRRVVRLKGGDPFVFGRGGEEIGRAHV